MKALIGIVVILVVGFLLFSGGKEEPMESSSVMNDEVEVETMVKNSAVDMDAAYTVSGEASTVMWSGKKPLVDGYINTGTLGVSEGSIEIMEGVVSGEFALDMNTLTATEAKAKPGAEALLTDHLKGERWFDVETHPTATFVITEAAPSESGDHMYDVTGKLTMKGETGELSFPAEVYVNEAGELVAKADFEFDRTKWGITAGSGSFFDDLADNVVDDMVALSFELVARAQ